MTTRPKRETAALLCDRLGLTWLLESVPQPASLVVLNFHRIGDARRCDLDRGVFSASAEDFDELVRIVRKQFAVLSLDEAIDWVARPSPRAGCALLLTFDDGYRDNYEIAYPILRSHGVQGTFFLSTSLVGSNQLSWWDRVAWTVRHARRERLHLSWPRPVDLVLTGTSREAAIHTVLDLYKADAMTDPEAFFDQLAVACDAEGTPPSERHFLSWDEAAEMAAAGMAIGAHTHSHAILAKMSAVDQVEDLVHCRTLLEERLGRPCDTLAYPVGTRAAFDATTMQAAKQSGYRAAFSFYGGVNLPGRTSPFNICRMSLSMPVPRARIRLAVSAVTRAHVI